MSISSFLSPSSPEVQELSTLLAPTAIDIDSGQPRCHWISLLYTRTSILLKQDSMVIPDNHRLLQHSIQNIKDIQRGLLSSPFFKEPLTLTYLNSSLSTWNTKALSRLQIFQILASLVVFLKNQLLYCTQLPFLFVADQELMISTVHHTLLPLLEEMKSTFLSHVQSPITTIKTRSLPSLTSLAALSVLKNPTNNEAFLVKNCSCEGLHLCFDDTLKNHPCISKLSPIIRKTFNNHELPKLIQPHLSLNLALSLIPGFHELTLESNHTNLPLFNLLPLSIGLSNSIQLRRLIQQRLSFTALSYPIMALNSAPVLGSVLVQKMIGLPLIDLYESLTIIKKHLQNSASLYAFPNHICVMNTMHKFFTKSLKVFNYNQNCLEAPMHVKSIESLIFPVTQFLMGLSVQLIFDLKHPDHRQNTLLKLTGKNSRHTLRKIDRLHKIAYMNHEVWLLDFLSEIKKILTLSHSLLLEKASSFGIALDLELEDLSVDNTFSIEDIFPIDQHHQQIIPSTTRKKVSFSNTLTQVLEFTPEPYETDPD